MNDEMHRAFADAFGAEHQLRVLVHSLHEAVRDERPWSREAAAEAIEILHTLNAQLEHHFAQEEMGGYLEEALNVAPRFIGDAAELLRQHPQLLDTTRLVRMTADRAAEDPSAWPQLKLELVELIKDLMAHESAENRIVQQAFNTGDDDLD
jgi:iron-sulfur cluster repair protein YtfE (RIC family)